MHTTSVTLVALPAGTRQSFSIDHAERLLRMPNSGWELPKDSDYEYDRVTGLHRKKAQRTTVNRKPEAE